MQYTKVPAIDSELPEAPEDPCDPCGLQATLSRLGLAANGGCDPEWAAIVQGTWWYAASCFAYCAAGGLLLLHPEPVERHMSAFPWRLMGLSVFANGFFSYMGDVETWGRSSAWKSADRVLATTNTVLQIVIVGLACAGVPERPFPLEAVAALATGVVGALACKQRAASALQRVDVHAYMRYHSGWHYVMCLGAIVAQLLLHRRCDYAAAGCACG